MTDLSTHDEALARVPAAEPAEPLVQWAPAEPAPRKRRWGLWIGIPAAALVLGAGAASLVLIAPGTSVAGVPVGMLTAGAATDAIANRLATTEITLGEGGPVVTGADLGASVDAAALAAAAFEQRPAWKLGEWFGDAAPADVTLDPAVATPALQAALPALFTAPTDAVVAFDGKTYGVAPDVAGIGIDVAAVETALQNAFATGDTAVVIEPTQTPVEAAATTAEAEGAAETLNAMLGKIGFYVGDERTVPVAADVAADWITVGTDDAGDFTIDADPAKIQTVVDSLAEKVNQEASDGEVIVNRAGEVLETRTEGQDGRVLGDTSGVANDFAAQLATGDGVYPLPVAVTPHTMTEVAYMLEVDLSQQRLYVKENDTTVMTWPISSGNDATPTHPGRYTIGWRTPSQTMTSEKYGYSVPNVAWVMYFNGDQGFHGAYWHNNFGHQMSHGCVNMPDWRAKVIYDWAPTGTDVWIHG